MDEHKANLINCCSCDKDLSSGGQDGDKRIIKYKCPGCERLYCNSECFISHKDKFQCSGIRNKTPYVHLSNFDQKQFLDDYFFLEEVNHKLESVQRIIPKLRANNSRTTKQRKNRRSKGKVRGKGQGQPLSEGTDKPTANTNPTQPQ